MVESVATLEEASWYLFCLDNFDFSDFRSWGKGFLFGGFDFDMREINQFRSFIFRYCLSVWLSYF